MAANKSVQQYQPLRIPSNWGTQEKKFIVQLTDILDDIYRRYGRFKLTDLGVELRDLVAGTITADRIDVDNLYVKHLDAADGTFNGTSTIVNPLNTAEQIIIGLNSEGNFGGFITRDNGATFVKWLDFSGLDGGAITPGTFDPLATPTFTYTGTYTPVSDGLNGWRIKFLTSGTFTPDNDMTVDIFLLGGGGSGEYGGGGGGYTSTQSSVSLTGGTPYAVVVGAGGSGGSAGNASSMAGYSANGGSAGSIYFNGGAGGSGGGASSGDYQVTGATGGTNGANGGNSSAGSGGAGQGTTTKEFGESTGTVYAGGGGGYINGIGGTGGGGTNANGSANTGGGGGGSAGTTSGGSGLVIIRNHRA